MRASSHPETLDGNSGVAVLERGDFSARSRKARICAEVYSCTPHKEIRSLTLRLLKSALSGRELARSRPKSPGGDCAVPDAKTSDFSISYRKARVSAEAYFLYVAQGSP